MIVLGGDLATLCTGWGVLSNDTDPPRYIDSGQFKQSKSLEPEQRTEIIFHGMSQVCSTHKPARAYFEDQFSRGRNTMYLARLQGACQAACFLVGAQVDFLPPASWRKIVFGYGNADKLDAVNWCNARWNLGLTLERHDEAEALCIAAAGIRGMS